MSSDEKRITPDELATMTEVRSVDSLKAWDQDPFGGADIGAETVAQARLGQTEAVLVHGDMVLWGGAMVDAERMDPRNAGTVAVVDVAPRWSLPEAQAEVLRRFRRYDGIVPDAGMLAELVTDLHQAGHGELLAAVGWDGDEIDTLLDRVNADGPLPSLDDGDDPDEDDMQFQITLKVPFDVYERWLEASPDEQQAAVASVGAPAL